VQLEVDGRRIVRCVRDYFLQYSPENAFLQCYWGTRMVPELFQVIASWVANSFNASPVIPISFTAPYAGAPPPILVGQLD
jgi:hypothetical protein